MVGTSGADDAAFKGRTQVGVADDPNGVLAAFHPAGQQGVVRENRAHPRHDGGVAVAVLMDPPPGLLPGDPLGGPGAGGDLAVHGHGVLHHHIGPPGLDEVEKDRVQGVAFRFQNAAFHLHAPLPQQLQPLARHQRIGIVGPHHHPGDARLQDGVGAGGLAALVAARFQGHV